MKSKCVHIASPPLVSEEVTAITLPRIHAYAERIGADVNVIGDERRFPEYPASYERLQIFQDGKGYEWNMLIDGDMLLGNDLADPTLYLNPQKAALMVTFPLTECTNVENRFFARDKRHILPVQWFLVTSHLTHEMWEPLPGPPQHHIGSLSELNRMAEYACAYNIAKYGLDLSGTFRANERVFKAQVNPAGNRTATDMILKKLREWGEE